MSEPLTYYELDLMLKELNWPVLLRHKPEFIVSSILKKLKKQGVSFSVERKPREKVRVDPVSIWGEQDRLAHRANFVYEVWRGYEGVILEEKLTGGKEMCRVRIRKDEKSNWATTSILKEDLCLL